MENFANMLSAKGLEGNEANWQVLSLTLGSDSVSLILSSNTVGFYRWQ